MWRHRPGALLIASHVTRVGFGAVQHERATMIRGARLSNRARNDIMVTGQGSFHLRSRVVVRFAWSGNLPGPTCDQPVVTVTNLALPK
jgi:hypothetical protein